MLNRLSRRRSAVGLIASLFGPISTRPRNRPPTIRIRKTQPAPYRLPFGGRDRRSLTVFLLLSGWRLRPLSLPRTKPLGEAERLGGASRRCCRALPPPSTRSAKGFGLLLTFVLL